MPGRFAIHECAWCDLQFATPAQVPPGIYEHIYRNIAVLPGYARYAAYAREIVNQTDPLGWLAYQEDVYWFVRSVLLGLGLGADEPVYEVGSGLGYLTYALRRAGIQATGLDISETAVEAATQRLGPWYRTVPAGALASIAPGQAAAVVMTELIEHIEDPEALLADVRGLLRPGGIMLITTPNKSAVRMGAYWDTENPPVHLWWFSETALRIVAGRQGLGIAFFDFTAFNERRVLGLRAPPYRRLLPPFLDEAGKPLVRAEDYAAPPPRRSQAMLERFVPGYRARRETARYYAAKARLAAQRSDSMGVILTVPPLS